MKQLKICILIPYFGKLPFWMPYFLISCQKNPTIDWVLYTDQIYEGEIPDNMQLVHITFDEYKSLVSERLSIKFNPSNAYKLCDIKPALAYVHHDAVANYDYWGFSDIDLIYGDLRAYFTDERLAKHALHSTHATRVAGHLCLIKNTSEMNAAFKKAKNWKTIFEDPARYAFDEKGFSKLFLKHKNSPKWIQSLAKKFNPMLKLADFTEAYSTPNAGVSWIDGSFNFPTEWHWTNGKLTTDISNTQNFPYFHFLVWKKTWLKLDSLKAYNMRHHPEYCFIMGSDGIRPDNK